MFALVRVDSGSRSKPVQGLSLPEGVKYALLEAFEAGQEREKAQDFYRELTEYFMQYELAEALDFLKERSFFTYLFYLYSRKAKACEALQPKVHELYRAFLQVIGSKLEHLIPASGFQRHCGYGFQGFLEQLAAIAHHAKNSLHSRDYFYDEAEFLAASLAMREVPVGTLVCLPYRHTPYWKVDFQKVKAGALIFILRPCDGSSSAIVVCRGTAPLPSASDFLLSIFNDMILQMGMLGVYRSWPELKSYLQSEGIQELELFGKSLGGAVAQMLAVLIEGILGLRVSYLRTIQSIGVDDEVHQRYSRLKRPFPIDAYVTAKLEGHADDLTPGLGGFHLGALNSLGLFRKIDVGAAGKPLVRVKVGARPFAFLSLLRGLMGAHVQQMRRHGFDVAIRASGEPKQSSGSERKLERIRRRLLCPLAGVCIALFRQKLEHPPFGAFFDREQQTAQRKYALQAIALRWIFKRLFRSQEPFCLSMKPLRDS